MEFSMVLLVLTGIALVVFLVAATTPHNRHR